MRPPLSFAWRNVLFGADRDDAWALFRLQPQAYPGLTTGGKLELLSQLAAFTVNVEADFQLLRISRAWSSEDYRRGVLAGLDARWGFPERLDALIDRHAEAVGPGAAARPEVFVAVALGSPGQPWWKRLARDLGLRDPAGLSQHRLDAALDAEAAVFGRVTDYLDAERATTRELQWLIRRARCTAAAASHGWMSSGPRRPSSSTPTTNKAATATYRLRPTSCGSSMSRSTSGATTSARPVRCRRRSCSALCRRSPCSQGVRRSCCSRRSRRSTSRSMRASRRGGSPTTGRWPWCAERSSTPITPTARKLPATTARRRAPASGPTSPANSRSNSPRPIVRRCCAQLLLHRLRRHPGGARGARQAPAPRAGADRAAPPQDVQFELWASHLPAQRPALRALRRRPAPGAVRGHGRDRHPRGRVAGGLDDRPHALGITAAGPL